MCERKIQVLSLPLFIHTHRTTYLFDIPKSCNQIQVVITKEDIALVSELCVLQSHANLISLSPFFSFLPTRTAMLLLNESCSNATFIPMSYPILVLTSQRAITHLLAKRTFATFCSLWIALLATMTQSFGVVLCDFLNQFIEVCFDVFFTMEIKNPRETCVSLFATNRTGTSLWITHESL